MRKDCKSKVRSRRTKRLQRVVQRAEFFFFFLNDLGDKGQNRHFFSSFRSSDFSSSSFFFRCCLTRAVADGVVFSLLTLRITERG